MDIDDVICANVLNKDPETMNTAREVVGAPRTISKWYDQGHGIGFLTA